jgi:hypothetical protein
MVWSAEIILWNLLSKEKNECSKVSVLELGKPLAPGPGVDFGRKFSIIVFNEL